ncbi:MAG: hypothetical protein QXJ06_00205 [Candidatus Aenigmatarchaeota archaeon]
MKKYVLVALVLLSIALVAAQDLGMQQLRINAGRPVIAKIGALGKGIAISTTDPLDFKIVKIGLVQVKMNVSEQVIVTNRGLIWLDDTKYQLLNATVTQNTISADVYLNNTLIGNLNLVLVQKNETSLWAGKIEISDKEYNVYILEGKRGFEKTEMGLKIKEFCNENDQNCNQIAKGIGNRFCEKINDPSCREKIAEFCEQNPNDTRCTAVLRNYCANNTDDTRCREMLRGVCKENPADTRCLNFCQDNPEACKIQIRQEVKERLKEKLQEIKENRGKMMGKR